MGVFAFLFSICVFCAASSVTWRKNNVEIQNNAFHVVKAEGESHSLLIKHMRQSNAGSYSVTAINPAGAAACGATLYIQSGEATPKVEGYSFTIGFFIFC